MEVALASPSSVAVDIGLVRRALGLPLPGWPAQILMGPRRRVELVPPARYLDGGVLVLLYPHQGALTLVLTRRSDHLAAHSGQVSFPGGLCEPDDASLAATALRETREELGLEPGRLELLGPLTPLEIPVSGYRIHPWVAHAATRPSFRPDPVEVAELIEVPLAHLLDPATCALETWTIRGQEVEVPFFRVGSHKVWGATAMVLSELVVLLRKAAELEELGN